MVDYTRLNDGELYHELGADGQKWAEAFKQHNPGCNVDDGQLLGWFCNAVMAGHDAALVGKEPSEDEIERVRQKMHCDYPLIVGYGLTENGRDNAVRDEHYRAAADIFARGLITALRSGERG
jgi:hypothetical protein